MSAWSEVQEFIGMAADPDITEDEVESELRWTYDRLASAHQALAVHDADGFFADHAGSPKCAALGHDLEDLDQHEDLIADGDHVSGWNGDEICVPTRWGEACTYCEGECDTLYGKIPNLWDMVRAKGES